MRKWEDIVKDKLEEADGTLPESVFAEFQARRSAAKSASASKRFPLVWLAIPAVAAGLAAILLLRQPAAVPEDGIQLIQQPSAPLAVTVDTVIVDEPMQLEPPVAQTRKHRIVKQANVQPQAVVEAEDSEIIEPDEEETLSPEPQEAETVDKSAPISSSPFIPEKSVQPKTVKMKVGLAVGAVAGGGLLAAALVPALGTGAAGQSAQTINSKGLYDRADQFQMNNGTTNNGHTVEDLFKGSPVHYFPLKVGLSARIPVAPKLFISTGINYSLNISTFEYTLSGKRNQQAHYLGIPVRLDWVFASNRLLDVYVGGGLEGDLCVGATLGGNKISKDGFGLALQGAGGVQLNVTKHLGIYVEPQLSWQIPMNNTKLRTYRSTHPLLFTVAAGIRFNMGN
ncbi:MAG: outer membrane beta-barrel protein [Bacteroidales bacterium]|nr:outer membrane beta-barrel protein [Bacteroidales bacterium]